MRSVLASIALLCLAQVAAGSGAPSDPALAGQMVTSQIPGGQQTREYARNGRLIYEVIEHEKGVGASAVVEAIEREWLDDGTPVRDQTFVAGKEMRAIFWYMNGKVRETHVDQSLREPDGVPGTYVERYSDLGVLQSSGVYQGRFRPVGVHREYDEQGRLKREATYGTDGAKLAEKTFGAGGQTGSASYLPDGSRRLERGQP